MNRKYKFPCAHKHYVKKEKLDAGGKFIMWTEAELAAMYDPYCQDCRESYKRPSNDALFHYHWWRRNVRFNPWIFGMGTHGLGKVHWVISIYRHFGFWRALKAMLFIRGHYDQYQYLYVPFLSFHWAPVEFWDIQDGWIDLGHCYEDKPYVPRWWKKRHPWMTDEWLVRQKEEYKITAHLIKVAYRYQRMWENQLREKLKCKEGRTNDDSKCVVGTYGCKVNHEVK